MLEKDKAKAIELTDGRKTVEGVKETEGTAVDAAVKTTGSSKKAARPNGSESRTHEKRYVDEY